MSTAPTGQQYEITLGDQQAVVTELGATLRVYRVDGRDVVRGFGPDETVKGGRGQTLLPWPNRIRDGRYRFDGVDQQLALTEPARHNASHGLTRYVGWTLVDHTEDRVVSSIRVFPQPGWPGTLEAEITYQLGPSGLVVEVRARNTGDRAFPFGYGAHPYLTVGEPSVDDIRLTVPATSYLEVDDRMLPTQVSPVAGTDLDWSSGRLVADARLDTAFTGLSRGVDGCWRVRLEHGDRHAELWGDESMNWAQVFTGGPYRDWGLAVEPMTCGPDAFNAGPTDADVRRVEPGESVVARWGVSGR